MAQLGMAIIFDQYIVDHGFITRFKCLKQKVSELNITLYGLWSLGERLWFEKRDFCSEL